MVVTVVPVRMVQATIDQVVDMVTVWHRFVAATGSMDVTGFLAITLKSRRALLGVGLADLDRVLDDGAILRDVVEMAIVEIIDVVAMLNRRVATARTVLMFVVFVNVRQGTSPCSRG